MLAPHQTPTLIDCLLLKNSVRYCLAAFANRFVRQQQRSEIMQCFAMIVNPSPVLLRRRFRLISCAAKAGREL
jgi:hypothetical protein